MFQQSRAGKLNKEATVSLLRKYDISQASITWISANQRFQYNSVEYRTRAKLSIERYDAVYIGTQVPHSLLRKYCDHLKSEFLILTNCHFSHFSFIYLTYVSPPMLAWYYSGSQIFLSVFLFYFIFWPLLPNHCRCRWLLLQLITLNETHADTHTHTHTHTAPHSVGILWLRDGPVAQTSTLQHTTFRRDKTSMPPAGF